MDKKIMWILIVVGIIGLAVYFQPSEKTFKKMAGTALVITDLTNIDISGLANQSYTSTGYGIQFYIRHTSNITLWKGYARTDDFIYFDGEEIQTYAIKVMVYPTTDAPEIDLHAGDYITLTYDGGQTIKVYFPAYKSTYIKNFYIANTGETYYDSLLTLDACTIANGCVGGVVCDCTVGVCCSDGCNYDSSSTVCGAQDCDYLDTTCRDYNDKSILCTGSSADCPASATCNVYTNALAGTACGTGLECDGAGNCVSIVDSCNIETCDSITGCVSDDKLLIAMATWKATHRTC